MATTRSESNLERRQQIETETQTETERGHSDVSSRVNKILNEYGRTPLSSTSIQEPLQSTPETILAFVLDALLKSRPISHDLAQRAANQLIEEGYHDINVLAGSTWQERTKALQAGGYNRYREQGATNLGDLATLVNDKYSGDLNNLVSRANRNRDKVKHLIKEVKGLGDLGADIFLNNVQSVWPSMAPFVDARSIKAAEELGLGTDLEVIYRELGHDSFKMSRFANGLSAVRLEKKVHKVEVEMKSE
ncbi:hypothetical protein ASPZODRAFT_55175 [Penicilliopsis zonata CBS 506.65]|uniref:HhH-GPD domain-containing protein n=1 Tax=Penicilliopsis zonata CBS 506.65 TaxID=1073090 RepID=A0A1L9SUS0_9EURO|nr:hypothetical protein ASPZODRAFT_55175 [Penicilliopsis zonata CBS 506.65]OJJ50871.1 hypothetical protein ASPZODRAFT_55175 [Penicilliopsis zonata CBS 506.65]